MSKLTLTRLARPLILAGLMMLVLLGGAGGSAWAGNPHGGTVPRQEADLSIKKTGSRNGPIVSFSVTITNHGPTVAKNVVMSDTLPGQLSYFGSSDGGASCTIRGRQVSCRVSKLNVGQSITMSIKGRIVDNKAKSIKNTATVVSETRDPKPANNTSSAVVTLR